jgi:SecD/SecF fusion protein
MQGKGVIKFFAIILALACIYQLSFTWVAHKVENDAHLYAKGDTAVEKAYLDSISTQPVYPVLGHTYQYCLANELALGLDLKGGMNVTMQISLKEVVKALSNNNPDPVFNQALENASKIVSQTDYITLFVQEYEKLNPNGKLSAIFSTKDNQANLKYNASNDEVEKYLKSEAETAVQQSYTVLNTRIDQFGVTQPNISLEKNTNRILIELPGVKDPARVRKLLSGTAKLEFYETFQSQEAYPVISSIDNLLAAKNKAAVKDSATTAVTAATDTAKKDGLALLNKVQKNNAKDTSASALRSKMANEHPLLSMLVPPIYADPSGQQQLAPGPIAGLAEQKDIAKINALLNSEDVKNIIPRNMKLLWSVKPRDKSKTFELYAVKLTGAENGPVLSGDVITDARNVTDQQGQPEVEMTMNSTGAQKWRVITAEAAAATPKKSIAIVLDDNVYSAPTVQNEISGGISSISGSFTVDDTKDLANVLKAGRLDAPARIIGEEIVGPSLGQQSINSSLLSCLLGFIVVLVFMIAYYNRAGTVAVVAVIINVFFLMGILTSIHAVLTVPGVAGIVLTLGMAVDANVLIYERVREEIALGKSLRLAINDGFKHALSSILDSNITTFLTGVILFIFGSGPIQGFATTLMIGIITSLFTALLISRLLFEWLLDKGGDIKFSNPWSANTFKNANFGFIKHRFKFYALSGAFIIAGFISIATQGFNYGVDFEGGRNYVVHFENKNVSVEDVREAVEDVLGRGTTVKTFGEDKISITTNYLVEDNSTATDNKVEQTLIEALNKKAVTQMSKKDIQSSQKVQATIADGLRKSAIWTVILAILVIAAYILVRFRKWQFSVAAMIATAHDALIVISFFSIFKDVIPFLEIDQAFIAAVLTVIGYSINDTVVVFDRIREYLSTGHSKGDQNEIINAALNNTLSRTIITALTVLFVLIVLFIFGGDVIRGFSFALLIGITFGVYSSLCVATPIIVDFGKKGLK